MRLGIVVLKFKSTFFVNVQDMGIQIFVISLMLSAISHMHMPVKEKFRAVGLNQLTEYLKALMGKIPAVV